MATYSNPQESTPAAPSYAPLTSSRYSNPGESGSGPSAPAGYEESFDPWAWLKRSSQDPDNVDWSPFTGAPHPAQVAINQAIKGLHDRFAPTTGAGFAPGAALSPEALRAMGATAPTAPASPENSDFITKIRGYLDGTAGTAADQQYDQGAQAAQSDISSQAKGNQGGQNIGDLAASAHDAHARLGASNEQGKAILIGSEFPGLVKSLAGASGNAGAEGLNAQGVNLTNDVNAAGDASDAVLSHMRAAAEQQIAAAGADQARVGQIIAAYQHAVAAYRQQSEQVHTIGRTVGGAVGAVGGGLIGAFAGGAGAVPGAMAGGAAGGAIGEGLSNL